MMIMGVDYHPSFQTIAFLMEETGECDERQLNHSGGEAERFQRNLQQRGVRVCPDGAGGPSSSLLKNRCSSMPWLYI